MDIKELKNEDIKLIKEVMLEDSVSKIATCQECKSTMDIDTFYKEMDKAHRLIYLVNLFNNHNEYRDMKFYEFDDNFGYYALIGAKNEQEAIEYYQEVVADVDDINNKPLEITKEKAKNALLNNDNTQEDKYNFIEEFIKHIYQDEPYLILIDGSLV